jgi:D-alanyl-D-alanine carboxypeptidase
MSRIWLRLGLLLVCLSLSGCFGGPQPAPVVAVPSLAPVAAPQLVPTVLLEPTPIVPIRIHRVRQGDTLALLAERYAISVSTLRAANALDGVDELTVGQELRVPTVDGAVHTLRLGETLREVAEWYGVPLATVIEVNRLSNPDLIAVDTPILIPGVTPTLRRPTPTVVPPTSTPVPTVVAEPEPTVAAAPVEQSAAAPVEPTVAAPLVEQAATAPVEQTAAAPAEPTAASPVKQTAAARMLPLAPRRIAEAEPPEVTAQFVAIVDEDSGELLFGHAEHDRVAPASITKIATTLVALEREPDLDRRFDATISGSAMAARDGSSIMGLEPGENISLATLLFGMMLPSGNDAAEQVALSLAGSRAAFVEWMNQRVAKLGLRDTHFVNPSGMDSSGHFSTAYDMALLGREAMRNEAFREMAQAATYRGDGYRLTNLNRLIGAYPGADGIKIGSTRRAGKTIVASATRNGHRVYVALLRSSDLPGDSSRMFDWTWRSFAW